MGEIMCDCWLGILNSYDQSEANNLFMSNIKERLEERSYHSIHSIDMTIISNGFKAFSSKDYIDRRKGLATLFNFCPLCGLKINWSEIRKNCG